MSEKLTRDELVKKLKEQIELLQAYAELYDRGITTMTLPMATAIRVLFHDTNKSVSLIKLLCDMDGKDKRIFEMITTKTPEDGKAKLILLGDGLCVVSLGPTGSSFLPKLQDSIHTKVAFCNWWNENVIKNVSNGFENPEWMTREKLITLHTNKEGGAHVDENKNIKIDKMGTKEAAGWVCFTTDSDGVQREGNYGIDQKKASIRQVCYEVLVSLHNHFSELFKREYY